VGYAPVDGMILLAVTVNVSVQQFPNAAWALYRTKYPFRSPLDDPKSRSTVTKFANRIVMDTASHQPDGRGQLYFGLCTRIRRGPHSKPLSEER
jgi:hypothetical protein